MDSVPSSAPSPAFYSTSSSHRINPRTNYKCFMGGKTMTAIWTRHQNVLASEVTVWFGNLWQLES
ncbi:hypothetical protein N7449_001826 [Penicillium cf. viridicatum]|uniref:Uncharacterized protein n=1 Tax=Penicillium cf. viridicatum TaxID=2972119 RepID=A0A9W9N7J3_9EURO|nr:hypothetical protein N7449_001826 [Penicillium cf. viridicatum]